MMSSGDDPQPIRDAAVLLVVDLSTKSPQILMGRRHSGLAFMANKVVFPGGRVDPCDHLLELPPTMAMRPETHAALTRKVAASASPTLPRALALTAIREAAEETGALLAHSAGSQAFDMSSVPPMALPNANPWAPLLKQGQVPAIDRIHYFFRAITPPGQPRRFDTRFFLSNAADLARGPSDETCGELGAVDWFSFDDARQTELAMITRIVLDEAETRLDELRQGVIKRDLPFYYFENGTRVNEMISAAV